MYKEKENELLASFNIDDCINTLEKNVENLIDKCKKQEELIKSLKYENKKLKELQKSSQFVNLFKDFEKVEKEDFLKKLDQYIAYIDSCIIMIDQQ
jgi:hypothetical protein